MRFVNARGLQIMVGAVLVLGLYAVLAFAIYQGVAQKTPGANDFYSRWEGTRALLLRGENPYSDAVTREIQIGMYGRLALSGEDQVAFAYPLYAAFLAAPLAGLPYAQAQSLWMAFLVLAVEGGSLSLLRIWLKRTRPAILAALLLSVLLFYPSVRGIFMGQFALVSFFFLALACAAIAAGHDTSAGIFLASALVKPQPAALLVPILVIWAAYQRRWRVVAGAVVMLLALVLAAMIWMPTWPLDFIQAIRHYAMYEPVGPPVQTLSEWVAPGVSGPLTWAVSAALVVWLLWRLACTRHAVWPDFQPTVNLAAIVTTLMAGRMGTPDQTLLLIPWLYWVAVWWARRQRAQVLVSLLMLVSVPWFAFLSTLHGSTEHVGVTLVLPIITLAVFLWQETTRHAKTQRVSETLWV